MEKQLSICVKCQYFEHDDDTQDVCFPPTTQDCLLMAEENSMSVTRDSDLTNFIELVAKLTSLHNESVDANVLFDFSFYGAKTLDDAMAMMNPILVMFPGEFSFTKVEKKDGVSWITAKKVFEKRRIVSASCFYEIASGVD